MRGKVINSEKARIDKLLSNNEIQSIITALGTGFGGSDDEGGEKSAGDFDISSLRYHKIIIMTDADVDGSHIRTLLLTFFYRKMKEIIDGGFLYLALPPLYRLSQGKKETYAYDENERDLTIERMEKRLIPHTPCPLVHPLLIFAPMPTNKPPIIIKGIDDVTWKEIEF